MNNKKLIGILIGSISIVSLIFYSLNNGASNPATQTTNDVTSYGSRIFSAPVSVVARFVDSVDNLVNTFEENQHLKEKIDQAYELQVRVNDLEAQNMEMRQSLKLNETLSDYNILNATVIARSPDQWMETMTINVGANDGVEVDMAVMAGNGLIGRVIEVNLTSAKVLLLSSNDSSDSKVSAYIQTKKGSINGIISSYDPKVQEYIMTQVDPSAEIEEGDMVVSSGLGGVIPSTLLIGEVMSVRMDDFGLFQIVQIKPSGKLLDARFVSVIIKAGEAQMVEPREVESSAEESESSEESSSEASDAPEEAADESHPDEPNPAEEGSDGDEG